MIEAGLGRMLLSLIIIIVRGKQLALHQWGLWATMINHWSVPCQKYPLLLNVRIFYRAHNIILWQFLPLDVKEDWRVLTIKVKGAGGLRPENGQNQVLCCFWKRGTPATWCFLPDQKILFLAKVFAFWNFENTGNYSTRANFKIAIS